MMTSTSASHLPRQRSLESGSESSFCSGLSPQASKTRIRQTTLRRGLSEEVMSDPTTYHMGSYGNRRGTGRLLPSVRGRSGTGTSSGSYLQRVPGTPSRYHLSSHVIVESVSAPEDQEEDHCRASNLYPRVLVSDGEARDLCPPLHSRSSRQQQHQHQQLLDPNVTSKTRKTLTTRRKLDSAFRNDSLSSDQVRRQLYSQVRSYRTLVKQRQPLIMNKKSKT